MKSTQIVFLKNIEINQSNSVHYKEKYEYTINKIAKRNHVRILQQFSY